VLEWQIRRNRFNHDWLKNQYILALANFLNILDGQVENAEIESLFVAEILPEWESHRAEAFTLPKDFERDMSPRRKFDHPPLARCDEETREWLSILMHKLWLSRYPINSWIEAAMNCAQTTDAKYKIINVELGKCSDKGSAEALRPYRELFIEFSKALLNLAKSIEKFPNRIMIT
jgi:hypothetical protein